MAWEWLILGSATLSLTALIVFDLIQRRLPDLLNLLFGLLGLSFHFTQQFALFSWPELVAASTSGAALLLGLRAYFWHCRQVEGLGLGDVKYIAAAGFWVGLEYVFVVIFIGAVLSLSGLVLYALAKQHSLSDLRLQQIPFGPGLILSTVVVFLAVGMFNYPT